MAVAYEIIRLPSSPVNVTGSEKNEKSADLTVKYNVIVSDSEDADFDPRDIDETDAVVATGLPTVNLTSYTTSGGKIVPYMICRGKTCERDSENYSLFRVTTKFKNLSLSGFGQGSTAPITPPAALTSLTPQIKVIFGDAERVLYIDKSDTPKAILTPTKNFYSSPAMEKLSTIKLEISQYEAAATTYEQVRARRWKVNDATFQSKAAYTWLITDAQAAPAVVTLSGGATAAALVTYTIEFSPFEHGWKDDRSLIDTHFIDGSGKKIAFADDSLGALSTGFIAANGTRKSAATVVPDRTQFLTFDDITFSSFLHSSLT